MARTIDFLEWPDQGPNDIIKRVPEYGNGETRFGSQLIVRTGQEAIFFKEDFAQDIFKPGKYVLARANLPRLLTSLGDELKEDMPFSVEVLFIATKEFSTKWGTAGREVMVGTNISGRAFVGAWGEFSFQIVNGGQFVNKLIGQNSYVATSQILDFLRGALHPTFQEATRRVCVKCKESIADVLNYRKDEITEEMLSQTQEKLLDSGIAIKQVSIANYSLADDNEELLRRWGLTEHIEMQDERSVDPSLVFVIMAFTSDMEPVFVGVEAAANSVGLVAKRVKDVPGDYRITDQIIEMIHSARLIVADLTHERPNVYFELGYARGIGKTVITIVREGTNVHFDVKDWTYISYTDSRFLERDLKKRFEFEIFKEP